MILFICLAQLKPKNKNKNRFNIYLFNMLPKVLRLIYSFEMNHIALFMSILLTRNRFRRENHFSLTNAKDDDEKEQPSIEQTWLA